MLLWLLQPHSIFLEQRWIKLCAASSWGPPALVLWHWSFPGPVVCVWYSLYHIHLFHGCVTLPFHNNPVISQCAWIFHWLFVFPEKFWHLSLTCQTLHLAQLDFVLFPLFPSSRSCSSSCLIGWSFWCIDKHSHFCVIRKFHDALLPLLCDRQILTKSSPQVGLI